MRSFRWGREMCMGIRRAKGRGGGRGAGGGSPGLGVRHFRALPETRQAASLRGSWPVGRSRLPGEVGGLVVERRQFAVGRDNFFGFRRIFLAYQENGSTNAGESVLDGVDGFQVGVDAGGFEQALHDDGFVLLLGVKNLDELFIGLRSGRGTSRLWHASSVELSGNRLRQSPWLCLGGTEVCGQGQLDSRAKAGTMAIGAQRRGHGQNPTGTGSLWTPKRGDNQEKNITTMRARRKREDCGACR